MARDEVKINKHACFRRPHTVRLGPLFDLKASRLKQSPSVTGALARLLLEVVKLASLLAVLAGPALAQSDTQQFWPEIDVFLKLNSNMRGSFYVNATREDGQPESAEIGPNLDIFFKPMIRLKKITVFQLDESKQRPLVFRIGYRYMPSLGGPTENRAIVEATPRYPLVSGFLVSNRNRVDFRFIEGDFSWRYRNRLTTERTFAIRNYHITPYARGEVYYDSRYGKFSRTSARGGCIFPFRKRYEFDTYYEHQNDTGTPPNQQLNAYGLVFRIYLKRP